MADEDDIPDEAPAVFVNFVPTDADESALTADLYEYVWSSKREHAVLRLRDGRRALVYGGQYAIILDVRWPSGPARSPEALIDIDGHLQIVVQIELHMHPKATGPSDGDFRVLELLGQAESVLWELWGGRTVFRRKSTE